SVAVRRGGGAVQAGAHRVDPVERAQQSGELWGRVIDLLFHLPVPRHDDKVLWGDEHEPRGPDLHVDRIFVALQLDLAAQRTEGTGGAIHRVQPVVVARKDVECRPLDGVVQGGRRGVVVASAYGLGALDRVLYLGISR